MSGPDDGWRELSADLRAPLRGSCRRRCRVEGPRIEAIRAEGRQGESVEAAEAALVRAEAAPQLAILRPED
jgi:hypothetical protein